MFAFLKKESKLGPSAIIGRAGPGTGRAGPAGGWASGRMRMSAHARAGGRAGGRADGRAGGRATGGRVGDGRARAHATLARLITGRLLLKTDKDGCS